MVNLCIAEKCENKAIEIRHIFSTQKISKEKLGRMFGVSSPIIHDVINNVRLVE
jgi:hypothetical protein